MKRAWKSFIAAALTAVLCVNPALAGGVAAAPYEAGAQGEKMFGGV